MLIGLQAPSDLAHLFTWRSTDNALEMSISLCFRIFQHREDIAAVLFHPWLSQLVMMEFVVLRWHNELVPTCTSTSKDTLYRHLVNKRDAS